MTLLLACILGLFAVAGFSMWIATIRSKYRNKVHKSRLNKITKENKLAKVKEETSLAQNRVSMLRSQLDSITALAAQQATALENESASKRKKTTLEALQEKGFVTQADIAKAEEFKKKTASDASIPEVLVILGRVTPEQMDEAKYNP